MFVINTLVKFKKSVEYFVKCFSREEEKNKMEHFDVIIVGAGVSGLACAHALHTCGLVSSSWRPPITSAGGAEPYRNKN